ncbi:MAG: hypothetical protein JF607_07320 [Burkholderiales bacterium]|nr:hypothetical protein [Burkholderiales bacterium]
MSRKTFTVVGAAGDAGNAVVPHREAAGHAVRPVSCHAGVPLDNPAALRDAFSGAFGAFVMMPSTWRRPTCARSSASCAHALPTRCEVPGWCASSC